MSDSDDVIARDVAAVGRIGALPSLLRVICQSSGMGFAAVARVSDKTWTACAVHDDIAFGVEPGGQLELRTTLCNQSRTQRRPVVFEQSPDACLYRDYHSPRQYSIKSCISVPIVMPNGDCFGSLCALDPSPDRVMDTRMVSMFTKFAEVIGWQLEDESRHEAARCALATERATAELREQFIAVLAHDLRNPLAAVDANAELLLRRTAAPDLATMGKRLRNSTRRMARMIDDVLDSASGRLGGGLGVTLATVDDLAAALQEVVSEASQAHPGRPLQADLEVDGTCWLDRGRVQQLLSNLLANAITHGAPDRPVRLSASIEDGVLVLRVSNQGEAIPAENLGRVFEPFWRRNAVAGRPQGGLGLGLYICAEIAKAHGGTISVTSSAALGTCFETRLPARR